MGGYTPPVEYRMETLPRRRHTWKSHPGFWALTLEGKGGHDYSYRIAHLLPGSTNQLRLRQVVVETDVGKETDHLNCVVCMKMPD